VNVIDRIRRSGKNLGNSAVRKLRLARSKRKWLQESLQPDQRSRQRSDNPLFENSTIVTIL